MMRVAVVWVKQSKAYLPTQAQTEAGYFMGIEPICVADLAKGELTTALEKVLATGHPRVPTPTREDFRRRKDPLLEVAKARSWQDFEKDATAFTVTWTEEMVLLDVSDSKTEFQHDPARRRVFPLNTSLSTIAEAILGEA